jgi:hypothetical protein
MRRSIAITASLCCFVIAGWIARASVGAQPVAEPVRPVPVQPVPVQPVPVQPVPVQPVPVQPVPVQPLPAQPVPAQPVPAQPAPAQPVPAPAGATLPPKSDSGSGEGHHADAPTTPPDSIATQTPVPMDRLVTLKPRVQADPQRDETSSPETNTKSGLVAVIGLVAFVVVVAGAIVWRLRSSRK